MTLRELIVKFGFDIDFTKLEAMGRSIDKQKKSLEKMTDSMQEIGGKMSLWVTAPLVLAAGVTAHAAAEMEDSLQKVKLVFGEVGEDAEKVAEGLVQNFAQSREGAAEMLARIGMSLQGLGVGEKQALSMSEQLATLAIDIKHFANSNMSVEDVSEALTRGLMGAQRGLMQFGIKIGETELKTKMQALAMGEMKGKTEEQIKAMATYQLILEKTKKMQGEYGRSQGELGRATDDTKNKLKNTAATFGKILLPYVVKFTNLIGKLVDWLDNTSESTKKLIIVIGATLAVVGPLLVFVGTAIPTVLTLAKAFTTLGSALGFAKMGFLGNFGASLKLIGTWILLPGLILLLIDDLVNFAGGENSVMGDVAKQFMLADSATANWMANLGILGKTLMYVVTSPLRLLFSTLRMIGGALGAITSGDFGSLKDVMGQYGDEFVTAAWKNPSLSSMMGFGATEAGMSANAKARAGAMNPNQNQVSAPITINVPPSTSPEQVGPFVQQGLKDGLEFLFKDTALQVASPIKE